MMTELAPWTGGGVPTLTIRVTDLVLDYEIHEDRRAALRQRFVTKSGTGRSLVHALKGVSFDAAEGDAIGVIGSNGSGKSTLLAAVAGLLAADERRDPRRRGAEAARRRAPR